MTLFLGEPGRREPLALGRVLGEGASGRVFQVPGRPGVAAKVYSDGKGRDDRERKLDLMLAAPPELPPLEQDQEAFPQIAWPTDKLFDAEGRFAGFLMPEISFERSTSLVNLMQRSSRRAEKLSEYYGYRVLVARNLAAVAAELHQVGHAIIDMKPANLRFYPSLGWMAVVDADGFSIAGPDGTRIAGEHVSDEFIAPESWQRRPSELGEAQDRFSLAVVIFQLLNNGLHPFAGASGGRPGVSDLQGRILAGLYAYGLTPRAEARPSAASLHDSLPRLTREMFDAAFLAGGRRPSAAAWRDHLGDLLGALRPCPTKPAEHAHFGLGCGFCAQEVRTRDLALADASRRAAVERRRADRRRPPPLPSAPAAGAWLAPARAQPRRRLTGWQVVAVAAGSCAALALLGSTVRWPSPARALAVAPGAAAARPAEEFIQPRDYVVLPGAGATSVNLRSGPGTRFSPVGTLLFNEDVAGYARTIGEDGRPWVRVSRATDGISGYVAEHLLMDSAHATGKPLSLPARCRALDSWEARTLCGDVRLSARQVLVDGRLHQATLSAPTAERSYLTTLAGDWRAQRATCRTEPRPLMCLWNALDLQEQFLARWQGSANSTLLYPEASDPLPTL